MIVSVFLTALMLILLLNPINAIAQEPVTAPNWHDRTATEALLAVLANRAEQIDSLQGKFQQQKQLQGLPLPLTATGNFSYSQHQGLNWHTLSPIDSQLQIGNKSASNAGTLGSNTNASLVADIFIAVVRGDLRQLQQYFTIQSSGDTAHWRLRLTPIKETLASYLSYIDVAGAELTEQLYIAEAGGDTTSIKLSNSVSSTQANEVKGKGIVKGEQ